MLTFEEKEKMGIQAEKIGKKIMQLSKTKKSFGAFFLPSINKKVMEILPYLQQVVWGVPMNEEKTIFWECHKDLSNIDNYDLSIIFIHKKSKNNTIILKKSKQFKNTYEIVIKMLEDDFIRVQSPIYFNLMKHNPYL